MATNGPIPASFFFIFVLKNRWLLASTRWVVNDSSNSINRAVTTVPNELLSIGFLMREQSNLIGPFHRKGFVCRGEEIAILPYIFLVRVILIQSIVDPRINVTKVSLQPTSN